MMPVNGNTNIKNCMKQHIFIHEEGKNKGENELKHRECFIVIINT